MSKKSIYLQALLKKKPLSILEVAKIKAQNVMKIEDMWNNSDTKQEVMLPHDLATKYLDGYHFKIIGDRFKRVDTVRILLLVSKLICVLFYICEITLFVRYL